MASASSCSVVPAACLAVLCLVLAVAASDFESEKGQEKGYVLPKPKPKLPNLSNALHATKVAGERVAPYVDAAVTKGIELILTARRETRSATIERREDELDRMSNDNFTSDMLLLKIMMYDILFTKSTIRRWATTGLGLITTAIAEEVHPRLAKEVPRPDDTTGAPEPDTIAAVYSDLLAKSILSGTEIGRDAAGAVREVERLVQEDSRSVRDFLSLPFVLASEGQILAEDDRLDFYKTRIDPTREWLQSSLRRKMQERALERRRKSIELDSLLREQREQYRSVVRMMEAYIEYGPEAENDLAGTTPEEESGISLAKQYIAMRDEWVETFEDEILQIKRELRAQDAALREVQNTEWGATGGVSAMIRIKLNISDLEDRRDQLRRMVGRLTAGDGGEPTNLRRIEAGYALDILDKDHADAALGFSPGADDRTDLCGRVADGLKTALDRIESKMKKKEKKFRLMRHLVTIARRTSNAVTAGLGLFVAGAGAFIGGVGEAAAPVVVAAGYTMTAIAAKGSNDVISLLESKGVPPHKVTQALFQWLIQMLEDPDEYARTGAESYLKQQETCYRRVYEVYDILTMTHDRLDMKINSVEERRKERAMNDARTRRLLEAIAEQRPEAVANRIKKAIYGYGSLAAGATRNMISAGARLGKNAAGGRLKVPKLKKKEDL